MQFFKEYLDQNILNNLEECIDLNNSINNRNIYGDIVYISNNEVVGIKERNNKDIVGILYLDSKIKYGNLKDKSLFLFKPTDKKYPNFYIPYKKNNLHKIYCNIRFKEWKITDKLPIGTLIDIIGEVGVKEVEYEHLRNFYNIKNNTWKIKNDIGINMINQIENNKEDYKVFSIDPTGSKDIDDAFHFKKVDKGYEIGIHIASPSVFFENNYLDIFDRVSTVYLPDKKYNMLPNIYADNYISLIKDKNRFSISIIFKINESFEKESVEIKESIVKNIKNYSYEEFDQKYINDGLYDFMELSKNFFNTDLDSHKLVENWMIYTNKFIANYLINNNFENIILRKHDFNENIDISNIDNDLKKYLIMKKENSASYELYSKNENQIHSKMNDYYTHFTSPIRRAVDFYIHMLLLKKKMIFNEHIENILDKINTFTKNFRRFNRKIRRLEFLYSIKNLEIETYGYIIDIKKKLTIYIPEYNLEEKILIIDKKFENICKIDILENDKIKYEIDDVKYEYNLYEKINVKLWVFTSFDNFFDKLKIEII